MVTAEEVEEWRTTAKTSDKPTITIGVDESRVVDEAIAAIAKHPDIFQRQV